jgi:organic hydroperoxide reductase OsmC/OhrA
LRKARVAFNGLEAHVATDVTRDARGHMRIGSIHVELVPDLVGTDRAGLERCEALFEDFCTVTASVRRGVDVGVSVREPALAGS